MANFIAKLGLLRQIQIIVASLCLVLAVSLAGLWIRSYSFGDTLSGPPIVVYSWHGQIAIAANNPQVPVSKWTVRWKPTEKYQERMNLSRGWAGDLIWPPEPRLFGFYRKSIQRWFGIAFPHWLPILIAGALAVLLKSKPRLRFGLREAFTLITVAAIVLGCLVCFLASG